MNTRRIYVFFTFAILLAAGAVGGCDKGSSTVATENTVLTLVDRANRGRTAIAQGPARNIEDFKNDAAAPYVFLIGENHANVLAQQQEIQVIGQLLGTGAIDAVLTEGSNGPVDVKHFAEELGKIVTDPATVQRYWKRELGAGRIGAGEYVALTHPNTPVVGVEDMAAKAKMMVAFQLNTLDAARKASRQRGAETLQKGLETVVAAGSLTDADQARVQAELQDYRNASDQADAANMAYSEKAKPLTDLSVDLIEKSARAEVLQASLKSELDVYEKNIATVKAAEDRAAALNKRIEEHNGLVAEATAGNAVAQRRTEELKEQIDRDRAALADAEAAAKQVEEFTSRSDVKELSSLADQIQSKFKEREDLETSLSPVAEVMTKAEDLVRDCYCIMANDLVTFAKAQNTKVPTVESFYRDEAEIAEKEELNSSHQTELLERDTAMAANTVTYLKTEHPCVALVVGWAHLEGVTAQLKSNGINVIRCDLPANDIPTTNWEERAYERRLSVTVSPLFSSPPRQPNILPEFSIKNLEWQKERLAAATELDRAIRSLPSGLTSQRLGNSLDTSVANRDLVVRVGQDFALPEANYGAQVVSEGAIPSQPERGYEAIDNVIAADLVRKYSDPQFMFVYAFRKNGGGGRVITPNGEKTLTEFATQAPKSIGGAKPNCVVMLRDHDEVEEGDHLESPTMRAFRGGGGHNGGNGAGNGGGGNGGGGDGGGGDGRSYWGATFLPDPRDRIPDYQTINIPRAQGNLKALAMQDPSHFGEITFVDDTDLVGGLERLPFTPSRGDHSETVVIIAKNVAEFREAVKNASRAGKLKNKQIALLTCGDAFHETAALRELLLDEKALLVWVPNRQITPEAALKLRARLEQLAKTLSPTQRPATIDRLIDQCLQQWHSEDPNDPDLLSFTLSASWVMAPRQPVDDLNI